ncbi:hypothetical protein CRYUN_Cryun36dG0034400 [Craigia yunnanensis]
MRRSGQHRQRGKQGGGGGAKGIYAKLTIAVVINAGELWESAKSGGWRPSSGPRSDWPHNYS